MLVQQILNTERHIASFDLWTNIKHALHMQIITLWRGCITMILFVWIKDKSFIIVEGVLGD